MAERFDAVVVNDAFCISGRPDDAHGLRVDRYAQFFVEAAVEIEVRRIGVPVGLVRVAEPALLPSRITAGGLDAMEKSRRLQILGIIRPDVLAA